MARKEFEITKDERGILALALTREVTTWDNTWAVLNMVKRGWLEQVDYRSFNAAYAITELGRTVARQLGIGGGAE